MDSLCQFSLSDRICISVCLECGWPGYTVVMVDGLYAAVTIYGVYAKVMA
jgi:hypothetical protein